MLNCLGVRSDVCNLLSNGLKITDRQRSGRQRYREQVLIIGESGERMFRWLL